MTRSKTIKSDADALDRAWQIACGKAHGRAEQLQHIAKRDGMVAAREFAASCVQGRALGLKPWEDSPCNGVEGGNRPEDRLLDRMLAAGLSRWEPDPIGALEAAAGRRR